MSYLSFLFLIKLYSKLGIEDIEQKDIRLMKTIFSIDEFIYLLNSYSDLETFMRTLNIHDLDKPHYSYILFDDKPYMGSKDWYKKINKKIAEEIERLRK